MRTVNGMLCGFFFQQLMEKNSRMSCSKFKLASKAIHPLDPDWPRPNKNWNG
jgi:hypothetical protein